MKIYSKTNILKVDLFKITIDDAINFPDKENAGLEEYYVSQVYSNNHIEVSVVQTETYTSGVHDIKYDIDKKEIAIYSRFRNSAFLIYGFLIMPLIPIFSKQEFSLALVGITITFFVAITLFLGITIRSESKDIEREMILRINYLRRNRR